MEGKSLVKSKWEMENLVSEHGKKVTNIIDLEAVKGLIEAESGAQGDGGMEVEIQSVKTVVHEDQPAYKVEAKVTRSFYVLMDEKGNHIPEVQSSEEKIEEVGTESGEAFQSTEHQW